MNKLLSIDEFKASVLVVCLLVTVGCAVIGFFQGKELSETWLRLIEVFAYSISGVNIAKGISSMYPQGSTKDKS